MTVYSKMSNSQTFKINLLVKNSYYSRQHIFQKKKKILINVDLGFENNLVSWSKNRIAFIEFKLLFTSKLTDLKETQSC